MVGALSEPKMICTLHTPRATAQAGFRDLFVSERRYIQVELSIKQSLKMIH
jgi:hypothetical protein